MLLPVTTFYQTQYRQGFKGSNMVKKQVTTSYYQLLPFYFQVVT